MTGPEIAALVTAITALLTAVNAIVTQIRHIQWHNAVSKPVVAPPPVPPVPPEPK